MGDVTLAVRNVHVHLTGARAWPRADRGDACLARGARGIIESPDLRLKAGMFL